MSDYRESCIERKAVQRGIVEPRPIKAKATERKRFLLESLYTERFGWGWAGRYTTLERALKGFDAHVRKNEHWGWRLLDNGQIIKIHTAKASP